MYVPPRYKDQPSPGPWKWVPFVNWDGGLQAADGTYVIGNDETDNTPDNPHDATIIAAAPRMREMLLRLEWTGWLGIDDGPGCPVCSGSKPDDMINGGHAPDCELSALLKDLR